MSATEDQTATLQTLSTRTGEEDGDVCRTKRTGSTSPSSTRLLLSLSNRDPRTGKAANTNKYGKDYGFFSQRANCASR